ncbi:hypothetical protein KAW18_01475 [candidate division WOR-3 bacterium]|nr:hypothetical protein [candidate division WOR-3 bacterium]
MEYKKYHRRYPNWDYKAVSTKIKEDRKTKEIIYYTLRDNDKKSEGVEVYSGSSYIVGSFDRSYSRRYSLSKVPIKYRWIVDLLKKKHKTIKWSKKEYVNYN